MQKYKYAGPITLFGKCVSNNFVAETMADSESKAINNIKYQAKKKMNLVASVSGIELCGKPTIQ